jgi:DNA-binding CsgD family transcriptional regulator
VAAQLACALAEMDTTIEAEQWSREALAAAEASGDPHAQLDAIRARVMLAWRPEDDEDVDALGGRAIELADLTRRPLARLWGHVWRCDCAVRRVDIAAAGAELASIQALADRTRLPLVRWHLFRRQASMAGLSGDFDGCRRFARQAAEVGESWNDMSANFIHIGQITFLAALRGDPAELEPMTTGLAGDLGGLPAVARSIIAAAVLLSGDRDRARSIYEPLVPSLLATRTPMGAAATNFVAYLAVQVGDPAECAAIRDWIDATFGAWPVAGVGSVFYVGSIARLLGELDLAAGDPAAAIPRFETGLTVDAALGAQPFLATGRLGLARALAATGDLPRAIPLARAAAADARRLDMPGTLRAADEFLASASAAANVADPLTDREREVVALVAQALSNKEIAGALVLSERTVESHVRRILAKCGLTSRAELIRWYLQRP